MTDNILNLGTVRDVTETKHVYRAPALKPPNLARNFKNGKTSEVCWQNMKLLLLNLPPSSGDSQK